MIIGRVGTVISIHIPNKDRFWWWKEKGYLSKGNVINKYENGTSCTKSDKWTGKREAKKRRYEIR